ncbi:MAG: xanthine dehydrogenase family protein molybdopterin-binding subunit [Treponema sp.]|jgi:CO/xanthine dehydrogenase Mo-binding subunit|nr:xanthine dehydrogenase family protein molybdopterin-binding subunit [Treponema sp.]
MDAFVTDINIENSFFAVTIRSPLARGRLLGVECPQMPSSCTLITAEDIPGVNQLDMFPIPILTKDKVSYIGEPVGILVGPDELKLWTYAAECKVLIEQDEEDVAQENLGQTEEIMERNFVIGRHESPDMPENERQKVKTVVQGVYRTGIQDHWNAEPFCALTTFFEDEIITYTATQWQAHTRNSVAKVLGTNHERVKVVPTRLGLHLDGKLWYPSLVACHAALGAFLTRETVKLCLTREECFRYGPKRPETEIKITSSIGEDGKILKTDIEAVVNMGVEGVFTEEILTRICIGSIGAYRISPIVVKAAAVKNSIPYQGPFEGFGLSQGFFAVERHISRIADMVGVEPAEWRIKHALKTNGKLAMGIPLKEQVFAEQVIERVAAMSDYKRKWASYNLLRGRDKSQETPSRGIGIALAYQGSGLLFGGKHDYSVEVTLKEDGSLVITTSVDVGFARILRDLAVKILDVAPEKVQVIDGVNAGPATASRNVTVITKLVEHCYSAIKRQRTRTALPITVRRVYKPSMPSDQTGLKEEWGKIDPNALSSLSWTAGVVEVEVDRIPKIRNIWLCIEGGRIIAPKKAERSVKIASIHALNWASRENAFYTDGKIDDPVIYSYDVPSPVDAPPITVSFIENNDADPKGICELPYSVIPAAYAQAVSQARNHVFEKIPLNVKDIWLAGQAESV